MSRIKPWVVSWLDKPRIAHPPFRKGVATIGFIMVRSGQIFDINESQHLKGKFVVLTKMGGCGCAHMQQLPLTLGVSHC
jgi:hypothetical protein